MEEKEITLTVGAWVELLDKLGPVNRWTDPGREYAHFYLYSKESVLVFKKENAPDE